jgi:hypothetical protein
MSDSVSEKIEEFQAVIAAVATEANANLILYSGSIEASGNRQLAKVLRHCDPKKNAWLYLTTYGGSPSAAYQIARACQRTHRDGSFTIVVNTLCKSAGTLLALGGDCIVMSGLAELGPLDVQVGKPDALWERTSGLTPTHSLQKLKEETLKSLEYYFLSLRSSSGLQITTRTALDVAASLVSWLFEPVFAQIDPMRLGEIQRAMLIAKDYGERLCKEKCNAKPDAIETLIRGYPSHDFVIDIDDARSLFNSVREPTDAESHLFTYLEGYVQAGLDADDPMVVVLNSLLPKPKNTDESSHENDKPRSVSGTATQASGGNDAEIAPKGGRRKTPRTSGRSARQSRDAALPKSISGNGSVAGV